MERINRDNLNTVIEHLSNWIKKAERGEANVNYGIASATNFDTGMEEHEHDGEISIRFDLYIPDLDNRAKLFTRCASRGL